MDAREAGIRYWLQPIAPEDMPALATEWLAAGIGGDAVVKSASSDFMDSGDIRDQYIEALKEVDAWLPSRDAAVRALVEDASAAIAQDENQLEEQAKSFRRLVDFNEAVTYSPLPPPYADVSVWLWFDGCDYFEEAGGLQRLRTAIREVVER